MLRQNKFIRHFPIQSHDKIFVKIKLNVLKFFILNCALIKKGFEKYCS